MQTRVVFIVHGREEGPRESVARFVARLGLNPIILHEQPDQGRTIIEKFEEHSADVRYAIVLLTADDRGGLADAKPSTYRPRARQNVILELGYFLGKLGRRRVSVIYEEAVEIPSDYQGVLYTPLDPGTAWRFKLAREMKAAGFDIDLNLAVWHRTSRKRSTAWRCASASRCAVARARPAGVTSPPKTTAIQN